MKQSITVVSGIGESTKIALAEHGIKTVADLAKVSVAKLSAVRGFGEFRAAKAIAAAVDLLKSAGTGAEGRSKAKTVKKTAVKTKQKKGGKPSSPAKAKKVKTKKKKDKNKKDKKKNKKSKKKK